MIHRFTTWIKEVIHDKRHKNSVQKPVFKDNYVFDLGYHQSYSLVIFLNCLIFSTIVPIIPFFAALFFTFKYQIDKYNLIFVYFKLFESGGKMRKHVTNLMMFNLYLYLILLVTIFSIKFGPTYWWGGVVIIVTWSIIYCQTRSGVMRFY
jgi:hypothetical protein